MTAWLVQKATGFVKIVQGLKVAIIRLIDNSTTFAIQRADAAGNIIEIKPNESVGYDDVTIHGNIEIGWPNKEYYARLRQTYGAGATGYDHQGYTELYSSSNRGLKMHQQGGDSTIYGDLDLRNSYHENYLQMIMKYAPYDHQIWLNMTAGAVQFYFDYTNSTKGVTTEYDYNASDGGAYTIRQRNLISLWLQEYFYSAGVRLWDIGLPANTNDYTIKNVVLSLISLLIESATNFVQAVTGLKTPVIRPIADGKTAIQIQNAAGTTDIVTIDTSNNKATFAGPVVLSLTEYADDPAAAAGGVAVGGLYRTGNVVKIRIA